MTYQPKRRLIPVAEYHKMGEVGILTEDDKVEWVYGEIVYISPIDSKHAAFQKFFSPGSLL